MSQTKLTRSEQKRQDILDAAKQAFRELGVQGTSMDELAARAQVSKRTVYNHFASKEILILELVSALWQQATQPMGESFDPSADLHTQLCRLIEAEIETICSREYIELNRVAFEYFFHRTEELKAEMEKFNAYETGIKLWIRAARDAGSLVPLDEEIASGQIHNLIKGSCFWPQFLQVGPLLDAEERHALADRTAAMFLNHYQQT